MPFKDQYVALPSDFIKNAKKEELIASGEPFEITAIRKQVGGRYGDQYLLSVEFADGETGTLPFTAGGETPVQSRDDMFAQLDTYFDDNPGETVPAKLTEVGRVRLVELV